MPIAGRAGIGECDRVEVAGRANDDLLASAIRIRDDIGRAGAIHLIGLVGMPAAHVGPVAYVHP